MKDDYNEIVIERKNKVEKTFGRKLNREKKIRIIRRNLRLMSYIGDILLNPIDQCDYLYNYK